MKYHRSIAKLALACLLFLTAALGDTLPLAAQRVEAFTDTISLPGLAIASGPSSPEEMEAFLDVFFETKLVELHIPGGDRRGAGWQGVSGQGIWLRRPGTPDPG